MLRVGRDGGNGVEGSGNVDIDRGGSLGAARNISYGDGVERGGSTVGNIGFRGDVNSRVVGVDGIGNGRSYGSGSDGIRFENSANNKIVENTSSGIRGGGGTVVI